MKGYFFNAVPAEDFDTYPTGYDRNYDADDFGEFFKGFFTNGVLINNSETECLVTASGSTLSVNAGFAIINGHGVVVEGTETVDITASGYAVIRWDKTVDKREAEFLVVNALVQTEDIYDLLLANVAISGTGNATVTDARTYAAYNGKVTAVDNIQAIADAAQITADSAAANASSSLNKIDGTEIVSGDNLNDYTTPGNYYCDTTTICNGLSNCPVTSRVFSLEVLTSSLTNTRRVQRLTAHYTTTASAYGEGKPTIWKRTKYATSSWSDWVQIYTSNDSIPEVVAAQDAADTASANASGALDKINGTAIVSGDDLNDYTTQGNYCCNTVAICNSLSNCPMINRVFSLEVLKSSSTYGNRVQRLTAHYLNDAATLGSGKPEIWERAKLLSDTWGEWIQICTSNSVTTETGSLSLTRNVATTTFTNGTTYTRFTVGSVVYVEIDLDITLVPAAATSSLVLSGFPTPKRATRVPFNVEGLVLTSSAVMVPETIEISTAGAGTVVLLNLNTGGQPGQWGCQLAAGGTNTFKGHFGYFLA